MSAYIFALSPVLLVLTLAAIVAITNHLTCNKGD